MALVDVSGGRIDRACRNRVALGAGIKDEAALFRSGIVEGDVLAVVPVGVNRLWLEGGIPRFAVEAAFCQYGRLSGPTKHKPSGEA